MVVPLNLNKMIKTLKEEKKIYHSESLKVNSSMGTLHYSLNISLTELPSPSRRIKAKLSPLHKVESVNVPLKHGLSTPLLRPYSSESAKFQLNMQSANSAGESVADLEQNHNKCSELY